MKKVTPITPEEFRKEMRKILSSDDVEGRHIDADNLLCETLQSLGYGDGVALFNKSGKWYA